MKIIVTAKAKKKKEKGERSGCRINSTKKQRKQEKTSV